MKITYLGHSGFTVEVAGKTLLFDPFIASNELAKAVKVDQVPADWILLTHGHADHVADAVAIAQRTGAVVVSSFEVVQWAAKAGARNVHPLNHGGSYRFDFGRVKYVNAIHSSSLPDGSYGGNPGGFVVETSEGNFYHSGDTALTLDMKLIGESTRLLFAFLCLGDNFTMGIDDAVKAAEFVGTNQVIGMHYDTFPPIRIDHEAAKAKFAQAGKELHLLPVGGSLDSGTLNRP